MKQKMKLAKKNESGQIFVLVLILLAIGTLLVVPMLHLGYSTQKSHQIVEINTLNAYAADSGVEYAKHQIYNFPSDVQAYGLDEYLVINGIDVHVTAEYDYGSAAYIIVSTASRAARSSTVECTIVIDVGLFGKVAACDGDLDIQYCVFDSTEEEGGADMYVNGNVSIIGSAADPSLIDGDVTASGNVTIGEHSTVTGTIREQANVMEFPPIDTEVHKDKAEAGGTYNGNYSLGKGTHSLGPLYINGNLSIVGHPTGNAKVTLQGTVYVTGTVTIDRAEFYGFGDILAEGDISVIRTIFDLDVEEVGYLPLLISVNGDIYLSGEGGSTLIQAIIYAPAADSQLSVIRLDVFGSVAARYILLDHSSIVYPAELRGRADLPGAGLDTVTYQFK